MLADMHSLLQITHHPNNLKKIISTKLKTNKQNNLVTTPTSTVQVHFNESDDVSVLTAGKG